mgnify:CR=1 FL=1
MAKGVFAALNIEKQERSSVLFFLIQSVFLGIFYGAFDVGAHALFLTVYPADMIPRAYLVSGVVGIVLTTIYARLQNKIPFSRLAVINLLFISVAAAVLRLLFQYTDSNWLIFLILTMMGPLNIIALLGFWGAASRIFTLRQGKRLFGLIDTGQIFGAILSTFAIPVLIAFGFEQKNLLFLSSVSVAIALIIQFIISLKFDLNREVVSSRKSNQSKKGLPELLKNKYILHMAIFVIMSVLAAFFIQYSFLSVTKDNYPNPTDMTEFLGAFTGTLLLFTFLFKTFVYSKLMKTYGLQLSILISPFLLGIFTLIAVLVGSIWGYTSAAESFIFFFLIISLSRLFSKALKDGVEVPSFKVLYQSLKPEIRFDVQAYIDGTINEIAALAAGAMLAVLGLFQVFTLLHFSYSLVIILVIWFFVARKLYIEYKKALQKSLADYKAKKVEAKSMAALMEEQLQEKTIPPGAIIKGLELNQALHPVRFESQMVDLLAHKDKGLQEYALQKILGDKMIDLFADVARFEDSDAFLENKELLQQAELKLDKSPGVKRIAQLSKSRNQEERITAAYLMGKFYSDDLFVYLKALMRDLQQEVQISAMKAVMKTRERAFCPIVCDYLDHPGLMPYAFEVLREFGDDALTYLDQLFYKTGTNRRTLMRIVKLLGENGSPRAQDILLRKLTVSDEEVLANVLIALKDSGYQADEDSITQVHQILEEHIGIIAYNFSVQATLAETEGFESLKKAIQEELQHNFNTLYLLLSLAYDARSIMHVKDNLESGTTEGISYALELLDLFIHDEIKPKLSPVVEDISLNEKVRQLQLNYPVEKMEFDEMLISLINRDVNKSNIWTKANAIYAFIEAGVKEIPDDLVAHLFNPLPVLQETSAYVLRKLAPEKLEEVSNRKDRLHHYVRDERELDEDQLILMKTWFLKSISYFKKVEGRFLYYLGSLLQELDKELIEQDVLVQSDLTGKLLLVEGEDVQILVNEDKKVFLREGMLYDMDTILAQGSERIGIQKPESSRLLALPRNELITYAFDFPALEMAVVHWVSQELIAEKEQITT